MDSISSRCGFSSLSGRSLSNSLASTSGREATRRRPRSRLQVDAALFEPPPFQPAKLSVQYLPGAAVSSSARVTSSGSRALPRSRRYTLTHNDITGALQLSIGNEYNQRQVQGFYTRILRDEITAEWLFGAGSGSAAPAELHIYCHVSGEERWLAPPQLRNFIFRREMTLVLDTFLYADRQLLQAFPDLLRAKVYVHFQSDVQDLDLREYWGVLGERASWRRMPKGVLARLKLLLFGFPAVPHQRPRHALTHQQQQLQQQGAQPSGGRVAAAAAGAGGVAAAAAAATAAGAGGVAAVAAASAPGAAVLATAGGHSSSGGSSSTGHHQWHPQAELAVEATRPVALSLQEQRQQAQAQHEQHQPQQQGQGPLPAQQEQPQPEALGDGPSPAEPCSCCSCVEAADLGGSTAAATSSCNDQQLWGSEQQQPVQPQQQQCGPYADAASNRGPTAASSNGWPGGSIGSSSGPSAPGQLDGAIVDCVPQQQQQQQQQQQWQLRPQQQQQQQQQRVQEQLEQAAMVEALLEYGRWSVRRPQPQQPTGAARGRQLVQASGSSSSSSSSSGNASSGLGGGLGGGNVLPAAVLGGPTALQLVLQQQQEQMLLKTAGCAAVVMATANVAVDASSTAGRCQ